MAGERAKVEEEVEEEEEATVFSAEEAEVEEEEVEEEATVFCAEEAEAEVEADASQDTRLLFGTPLTSTRSNRRTDHSPTARVCRRNINNPFRSIPI